MNKGDKLVCICNSCNGSYEVNSVYVISDTRKFLDGKYLQISYGDKKYMNFWFTEKDISDYFITIAEVRELQIKSVLDD